jgi:predicted phage tail protein
MSDFLFMGLIIVGLVLAFTGVVQLCVRKKTGPWKKGGASLLAGAIIAGVSAFVVWLTMMWFVGGLWVSGLMWWWLLIVGLVLTFNGVVQLCVRKKTGPWKEGGASLLAGAIIAGVSVFGVWLAGVTWLGFLTAGLVLAFTGVVQLCVRKKTGPWKEGGASLLAGAIVAGASAFAEWLTGKWLVAEVRVYGWIWWWLLIVGLVLAFTGVVQLCVRKKTGPWKEGGASLLAGIIVAGVTIGLMFWLGPRFIPLPD